MNKITGGMTKTKKMVLTALLFAVALVLSIVESSLPNIWPPVPGVKLGLSNIAVMFALFFMEKKHAYAIAVLKAVFVMMTRGTVAGLLSFSGGMLSLTIMCLFVLFFKDRVSYMILSIFGSLAHNVGQFVVISLIYTSMYLWVYLLPVLLISGIVAGVATAALLRLILPALQRLV